MGMKNISYFSMALFAVLLASGSPEVLRSFGSREGAAEPLRDLGSGKSILPKLLQDPFVMAQAPNVILYSTATKRNSYVAFMLSPACENVQDPTDEEVWKYFQGKKMANGKGWERKEECKPWGGDIVCDQSEGFEGFCIPCRLLEGEKCAQTAAEIELKCVFEDETETFIPAPFNCTAGETVKKRLGKDPLGLDQDCHEGGLKVAFEHFVNMKLLNVMCPIPPEQKAKLDAGEPISVILKHAKSQKAYPKRTIKSPQVLAGTPQLPHVELAAVLYYNLRYQNNGEILREWLLFQMMQGVEHFYVYYFSDDHLMDRDHWFGTCSPRSPDGLYYKDPKQCALRHLDPMVVSPVLREFNEAGYLTMVEFPLRQLCSYADPSIPFDCANCDNAMTQQIVDNHYLNTFKDFANYTIACDVDELMFGFGGTLNMMKRADANAKVEGYSFAGIDAPYNWWTRDNSTGADPGGDSTGLYFGRLNRYFFDGGFGKYMFVNARTYFADIHFARGGGAYLSMNHKVRTNHHRHGAYDQRSFMKKLALTDHQYPSPMKKYRWRDVYQALMPCMLELRDMNSASLLSIPEIRRISEPCLKNDESSTYAVPVGDRSGKGKDQMLSKLEVTALIAAQPGADQPPDEEEQ
jgi:hypothetical protein